MASLPDTLVRLAIYDEKISNLLEKEKECQHALKQLRQRGQGAEKRFADVSARFVAARESVAQAEQQLENERKQFSDRKKQIVAGSGGAQALKALERENDRATMVIDAAEKQLVVLREALARVEGEYRASSEETEALKAKNQEQERELLLQEQRQRETRERLERESASRRAELDSEVAFEYEGLRKKYKDPVSELDESSCGKCYSSLPLRIVNAVRSGTPQLCPECNRYLVASFSVEGLNSEELI